MTSKRELEKILESTISNANRLGDDLESGKGSVHHLLFLVAEIEKGLEMALKTLNKK